MMDPLVSTVTVTYNRAHLVKRAVESILSQSYKKIEVILVNNASTDKTSEALVELKKNDPRIVMTTTKSNMGSAMGLNIGVRAAKGKYIAILDDDDFWADPQKLEKQVKFFEERPEYALTGGGIIKINEEGEELIRYLFPEEDSEIRKIILAENAFAHSTVLYKKDVWEKAGGYNKEFNGFEDMDMWLKMGKFGKMYNFQEFFAYYSAREYTKNRCDTRDYTIRRKVGLNIKLRKQYKNNYSGYKKAIFLCWTSYIYSFLPFRQKLRPMLFKLRTLIMGPPAYKYFKK